MAEAAERPKGLGAAFQGLGRLPVLHQVGLLVGLAAAVALGVGLALWAQRPPYRVLYSGLQPQELAQVAQELERAGIPYELREGAGTVLVPGGEVHQARLKLAAKGLPHQDGVGFELLTRDSGFGVSQFVESARYQRALEGELARTITDLRAVASARVHLALPKRTSFLRDRRARQASASVLLNLYSGRRLDDGQVAAIAHLVASSVPGLTVDRVTVVDQQGNLLNAGAGGGRGRLTATQFEQRRKLEEHYTRRIESLLLPVVGPGKVRAQVSAELDFTETERTQERYEAEGAAVLSEQTAEERSVGAGQALAGGVPGSLSNRPPAGPQPQAPAGEAPTHSSKRVVRNYQPGRTISHVRVPGGRLLRLSVAVVVDGKEVTDEEGKVKIEPRSPEELARIERLVKEAVGFDESRGDRLSVVSAPFARPAEGEAPPEPSLLEQPWVAALAKQLLAGVGLILLILLVLRPVLRSLAEKAPPPPPAPPAVPAPAAAGALAASGAEAAAALPGAAQAGALPPVRDPYEERLQSVRAMVQNDPKRVAQVVKNWVNDDG